MNKRVYTVGQVNRYIRGLFAGDPMLAAVFVRGEVSNVKYHTSGHIYFSLKDATGAIPCVMFASSRRGLAFRMKDGDKVIAGGSIDVYERDGRYQLYADRIVRDGVGLLNERYELLKKKLEEQGMFDESYKQPIPRYIRTLGVVTAPTGAAVQDIINIARRRNPYIRILLFPAIVQGDQAKYSIIRGLQVLESAGADTIIIGRGGGSLEDLWAFNEEEVAQAVFDCGVPVISAVGHETDTVITDYVADLRAPTPSAAAELAVFDFSRFEEDLLGYDGALRRQMRQSLWEAREKCGRLRRELEHASPAARIREQRMYTVQAAERLQQRMERRLEDARHRMQMSAARLEGLSPLKRLSGGFVYASDEEGKAIKSVDQVREHEKIRLRLSDGGITAGVEEIWKN